MLAAGIKRQEDIKSAENKTIRDTYFNKLNIGASETTMDTIRTETTDKSASSEVNL